MLIFWRLMLGHLLGDFTLQTDLINSWKRKSHLGMFVHCVTHPIAYIALTYPYLNHYWVQFDSFKLNGWACVLLLFLMHWIEDEWRVYTVHRYQLTDNTWFFLFDQAVHYLCIFIFFPLGLFDLSLGWFPEKWPVLGCLAVLVTHYTTVLIYFVEKDLYGTNFPKFEEKYVGIFGRLVLAACFLVPAAWWPLLAAAWLANLLYLRHRRFLPFTWFNMAASGTFALACGAAARLIYYR